MQIRTLRNSERFGAWIAQIARHLCVDTIRRRKTQAVSAPFNRESANHHDSENHRRLDAALVNLRQDYRVALLLFYLNGRSTKSIAETLGISRGAVQTRLTRARRKLRDLLLAEGMEQ